MRSLWKRILTGMLALALIATGLPMQPVLAAEDSSLVVVIDPGHDKTHSGADVLI